MPSDAAEATRITIDADGRRVSIPSVLDGLAKAGYNDVLVKISRAGVVIRAQRTPSVSLSAGTLSEDDIDRAFPDDEDGVPDF